MGISKAEEAKLTRRFEFGDNWMQFSPLIDDQRIQDAEECIRRMLGVEDLRGKSFLDIGSGSGLSSLAARRLGASVFSFDHDLKSVACTQSLKQAFFPDDPNWIVEEGSVLNTTWLRALKQYDVVYSWGVLHHTGSMWQALANVDPVVISGGRLFIAIYNDQGTLSDFWRMIKWLYNRLPRGSRFILTWPALVVLWGPTTMKDFLRGKPFSTWRARAKSRGMSPWHDFIDWVGGYPFEVARPDTIVNFYEARGYRLQKLKTCGRGLGCNEFVFQKL
jgi:SAM-dependent methyltransferase